MAEKINNNNDDMVAWRWEYAIIIIGVMSQRVKAAEMEGID